MQEILPIKVLQDEDGPFFGQTALNLAKLLRAGLPVAKGLVIAPPNLKLKALLEHFDFSTKEIFDQTLTLVKKEIAQTPIPLELEKELGIHKNFLLKRKLYKKKHDLWIALLHLWLEEIKLRIWKDGFYKGVTEGLESQIIVPVSKVEAAGEAYFDSLQGDVMISVFAGKMHPADCKKLVEAVNLANKKLFLPNIYEWIYDKGLKIVNLKPFTPSLEQSVVESIVSETKEAAVVGKTRSTIKAYYDLSSDFVIEREVDPDLIGVDGVFITTEKIFDLNKPQESFDNLTLRIVEAAFTFPNSKILVKLADKSEGMGKVRGALRLIHQKSLFDPIAQSILFARNQKGLKNIHVVIPFVRSETEVLQIKRELAVKKLIRKSSLEVWLEAATPENIVNLESYLSLGVDGIVLNMDELIAHLNGFDHLQDELIFYKNEVKGLLKFLEDSLKILHKSRVPCIATGSITLNPEVMEFLIEKGVTGIVVQKYEAHSIKDLLHSAEKRVILRKIS